MLEHELIDTADFLPMVRVSAPECPDAIMAQVLLITLQDFCEHTAYWQEQLPEVLTLDGVTSYALESLDGTAIVKVMEVANSEGNALTMRSGPLGGEDWWWQSQPAVLEVSDGLGQQFLRIKAAVKPTGTQVSATIFADYREAIEQGTLAKLYAIPNKPWSAPEAVGQATAIYREARAQAARKAGRGFATLPRRPQPKPRNYY